jgi:hypothetical protein
MLTANEWHNRFVQIMQKGPLIRQLATRFDRCNSDSVVIPITVNDFHRHNCYVVSPLTLIVYYSRDELPKVANRLLRGVCWGLTVLLEWPLRLAALDRLVVVNNQCLSTNMYSRAWQSLQPQSFTATLITDYPDYALMLRSVNGVQHQALQKKLEADGWTPVVTRQVYLFGCNDHNLLRHNTRMDNKLLQQPGWYFQLLDIDSREQFLQAEDLYNQLYLQKYSQHNIQFSANYLIEMQRSKLLKIYGLYHSGEILGVVGVVVIDGTMTVPIVGYDTSQPIKKALYRRLMAFSLRYARLNNLDLNLSSGAPDFKRLRGGRAEIEYSYVQTLHLPWSRRIAWNILSWLSLYLYRPLLKRCEL